MANSQIKGLNGGTPVQPAITDYIPCQSPSPATTDAFPATFAQVKATLSLNNVDNTSDVNKPVSTAQATAIAAVATKRRVYGFSATQVGASAPTITEFITPLGVVVWARSGTGVYTGTLAGAFTNYNIPLIEGVIKNGTTTSTIRAFSLAKTSADVITLSTFSNATPADSLLTNQYFELPMFITP